MKNLKIILFLIFCLTLSGCSSGRDNYVPPSRIVAAVDIYCQKPSGNLHRHYQAQEKMEAVLHYVRLLEPNGPTPVTEEAMQGPLYEIVVHLQDGGKRIHRQRAETFAALHRRYWGTIDRSLGLRLGHLMALLPSDPVDANRTDMPQKDVINS